MSDENITVIHGSKSLLSEQDDVNESPSAGTGLQSLHRSRYFRVSVTNRCNLSCSFCHREGQSPGLSGRLLLSDDLVWVVEKALDAGFSKLKLTGGEPTLRPDLCEIVEKICMLGMADVSLITNGTLLHRLAPLLKAAGLPRLNVSLHTLNPNRFEKVHGGSRSLLDLITVGIDKAIDCGFNDMKLNMVYRGEWSNEDLDALIRFAAPRGLTLVVLPVIRSSSSGNEEYVSLSQLHELVARMDIIEEQPVVDMEGITKRLFKLRSGAKILLRFDEVGRRRPFGACAICDRISNCREGIFPVRLSADGALIPCLAGGHTPIPLYDSIRDRNGQKVRYAFDAIAVKEIRV